MLLAIALVIGGAIGFVGSRQLRRAGGRSSGLERSSLPVTGRGGTSAAAPAAPAVAVSAPASVASPARLALLREGTLDQFPLIDRPVTVGRTPACDVTIGDDRVSRNHARIERNQGRWTVVDAGSSNGTTLNGRPVSAAARMPLAAGDVIGVGPFELRVVLYGQPRK